MPILAQSPQQQRVFVRRGFRWDSADAYLFDIDGTLLNSRDAVHYFAFRTAIQEELGLEASIDHVPVHGNTDPGILRAALRQQGLAEAEISSHLPKIVERMCAEVERNRADLRPEICPSIRELITRLREAGKLLGVVSGNLAPIGRMKLEAAGLLQEFSFSAFSHPRKLRTEIFEDGIQQARELTSGRAEVCIVGDTPSDIEAARQTGAPVIVFATGVFSFEQLKACGPDACFACAADLLAF
ncbi:MAG TPA: HAD hydrolase-like protein [Terriglobales bacterium]|nr:HAD hydrolase-like protein [Terriglobales bacterium]